MNKRIYRKVVKRIIGYPITNPPYVLTSLEKRVHEKFDRRCSVIADPIIELIKAEEDYYRYLAQS